MGFGKVIFNILTNFNTVILAKSFDVGRDPN
jgi:hypothetical protein